VSKESTKAAFQKAFSVVRPTVPTIPLLVHVPHSSKWIPEHVLPQYSLAPDAVNQELLAMTDAYTDEFCTSVPSIGGTLFINCTSRLVVDPERFESDDDEPMAATGMGAVYLQTSGGDPLRGPSFGASEREQMLSEFFRPYSQAIAQEVGGLLERFGRCLIVDVHSFPSIPLAYEGASLARPDICFGYDPFHYPSILHARLSDLIDAAGMTSCNNQPFEGSYVPGPYFHRERNVTSLMIEIKRSLYMDEATGAKIENWNQTRETIDELLDIAGALTE